MKILKEACVKGKRRVTVELAEGENIVSHFAGTALVAIEPDAFYKLGEPMNDVMQGHILTNAVPTTWCPIGQKWLD